MGANNKIKKGKKGPDACCNEKNIYQLKMFWEEGYKWHGSTEEKAWCAQCEDDCKVGENVIIKECNKKKKKQLWIFSDCYVRSNYDSSVCITASETRSDDLKGRILLQPCEDDSKIQKFRTFKTDASDKFRFKMLKPKNNKLCLTQEGRPDAGEELRFTTCEKAGNNGFDDTSYWVVGTFNGHPTTKENKKKAKKKSNP